MDDLEVATGFQELLEKENEPFEGLDDWVEREPMCPKCKQPLEPTDISMVVKQWDNDAWSGCIKPNCRIDDHVTEEMTVVSQCGDCGDNFIRDPTRAVLHLRCKCDDFDAISLSSMVEHMYGVHSLDKRGMVQLIADSKRPTAFLVDPGDGVVWIGDPAPSPAE